MAVRPSSDQAYTKLANALRDSGDADGAIHAYRKAIELNSNADLMRDLAKLLAPQGKLEAVRAAWAKLLDGNPPDHASWYGMAVPVPRRGLPATHGDIDRFRDRRMV